MWINDKWKMSEFAFRTILDDKTQDTEEMRAMIEEPIWIYVYCRFIKFRSYMKEKVSKKKWIEIDTKVNKYIEDFKTELDFENINIDVILYIINFYKSIYSITFPIIRNVYPKLIASELVSVQSMIKNKK